MIRVSALVLLICVSALPSLACNVHGSGMARSTVGPGAVWEPGPAFLEKAHERCDSQSFPKLGNCFAAIMKSFGASPEAVAFSGEMGNEAWLRAFRESGKVDIAYVTYPFRANENQGMLLVNGDPSFIDVDDSALASKSALEKDLVYGGLAKRYPAVSLWPGDRFGTDQPVMEPLLRGGLRFHVGYVLRSGCHACDEIGSAVFAFDFDSGGRFTGTRLMMVTDTTAKEYSDPAAPVKVDAGTEFSLVLASNPGTGYSWSLASAPEVHVVQPTGSGYRPSSPGLPGSGGSETWTFKAVGKGKTTIFLRYARPWEKGVEPIRQAAFVVVVR